MTINCCETLMSSKNTHFIFLSKIIMLIIILLSPPLTEHIWIWRHCLNTFYMKTKRCFGHSYCIVQNLEKANSVFSPKWNFKRKEGGRALPKQFVLLEVPAIHYRWILFWFLTGMIIDDVRITSLGRIFVKSHIE